MATTIITEEYAWVAEYGYHTELIVAQWEGWIDEVVNVGTQMESYHVQQFEGGGIFQWPEGPGLRWPRYDKWEHAGHLLNSIAKTLEGESDRLKRIKANGWLLALIQRRTGRPPAIQDLRPIDVIRCCLLLIANDIERKGTRYKNHWQEGRDMSKLNLHLEF